MNMPIGKLFYFVPKTSSTQVPLNGSNGEGNGSLPECVISGCGEDTVITPFLSKSLYDLFYNDGLYDASKGKAIINFTKGYYGVVINAAGENVNTVLSGQPLASDSSFRNVKMCITGFSDTNAGRLTGPDGNEMDTETFLSSLSVVSELEIVDNDGKVIIAAGGAVPFRLVAQVYGKGIVNYNSICTPTGCLLIELDLTHPACIDCASANLDGYVGAASGTTFGELTGFTVAWNRYETLEYATEMGEVSFELDEVVVSVTERKLRA
jgi:hypothetical protein